MGTPEQRGSSHGSCAPGRVLWVCGLTPRWRETGGRSPGSLVPRSRWLGHPRFTVCLVTDSASGPGHLCSSWWRRVAPWEVKAQL